jgi:heptosyltransferase I
LPSFLISRLSSLGDVVCALPVASALKATDPEARIVWAVDPRFAGVVECCTAVGEVAKVKPSFKGSGVPRFDEKFDAALDMQGLLKSAVIVWKAKADRKLGYHWQREGAWLFSERVLPDPSSLHIVDQYVDVARAAGGTADRAEFSLVPKGEDVASVTEKLRSRGIGGIFVVLNAGAGWATKRWPARHFAALIDRLAQDGIPSVLIGGKAPADIAAAEEVKAASKEQPVDLLGQTSVRELVALISMARAHVGGDTGSTHIAAALGVAAIGLYSITKPVRSCPYGQIERCHYNPEGLALIEPEAVYTTVREATA